jgi:hypothetical protein
VEFLIVIVLVLVAGIVVAVVGAQRRSAMLKSIAAVPGFRATQQFVGVDNKTAISLDEAGKRVCFVAFGSPPSTRVVPYKNVLRADILEDGETITSTSRTSQAGGALLGGVLLGPLGLLAGALTAGKTSSTKVNRLDLKVVISDTGQPIHVISFLAGPKEKSDAFYKSAEREIRTWHGRVLALIEQADADDARASLPAVSVSRADEFAKLAKLRDDGILTEAEFHAEKARILSQGTGGTA